MPHSTDSPERILIIDDEPAIRGLLQKTLRGSFQCTALSSAEEALALLATENFELVLSDIKMGGMSGLEMIPKVLDLAPETVVVMITAEQTAESAIEALRVGAFDYITKPFDLQHVEAAVHRALEHHSLLESKRLHENHLEELVRQRTAELNHLSYHDALTDLPNRVLFEDRVAQALSSTQRTGQTLCVIFLSIDRFKKIGDTLGHAIGYQLIRKVARRLIGCVHEGETVARFEGDDFALLLTQIGGTEEVVDIAQCIREALGVPFTVDGHELFITISLGISLFPDDGTDATSLLKNAGAALQRAKEQGGDNYQFYTPDMNARALKRLTLENNLRRALERHEFETYYQPKINTSTGRISGMEALVRWRHPEMGILSPAEFIPVAEDTGLIVPLGEWVLRAACAQCKSWQDEGFTSLSVAVNLSARHFQQQNLAATVIAALRDTGLEPSDLELELTESSIMKEPESAVRTLGELKAMGINISVDDFGTGFSSLSYLKRLPLHILKIDQSFVRDVTTDPDDAALVMAIVTLAHNLRLKVIAEGVETKEQLRFLSQLGCDEWQGYLFSRPVPAGAFRHLLAEEHAPV